MNKFERTNEMLKNKLIEYMENNDVMKLTVTDFCKYCNINRKTFYFHYSSIEDLMEELIKDEQNILNTHYHAYLDIDNDLQVSQMVYYFNIYMVEQQKFFHAVFANAKNNYIYVRIQEFFCSVLSPIFEPSKFANDAEMAIVIKCFVYALYTPYQYAYEHNIPYDDPAILGMTLKAFNIHDYIKKAFR